MLELHMAEELVYRSINFNIAIPEGVSYDIK